MRAIEEPADLGPPALLRGTPAILLMAIACSAGLCALLAVTGVVPRGWFGVAAVLGGQGVLLATALGWAGGGVSTPRSWVACAVPVGALAIGATLSTIAPLGAVTYVAVPVVIWWIAARDEKRGRADRTRRPLLVCWPTREAVLAGLVVGGLLGAHLLVSATRTLGYSPRVDSAAALVQALAYDAGANVLVAECFFRGALFDRLQRRWSFWPAATAATAACVVRYVVDPLLPKSPELLVGAVFYTGLHSLASCWLLWWSGSLVPGYVSGLAFFAAYRLLKVG